MFEECPLVTITVKAFDEPRQRDGDGREWQPMRVRLYFKQFYAPPLRFGFYDVDGRFVDDPEVEPKPGLFGKADEAPEWVTALADKIDTALLAQAMGVKE